MARRTFWRIPGPVWAGVAAPLGLFTAGCGAGIAGVAASSDSGGGGDVPPAITAFTVKDPKESDQATLGFTLSRRATVELRYRLATGAEHRMEQVGTNPRAFEAGMPSIPWNFAGEPGLAASFTPGVLVFARIPGVQEEPREGENALTLGMGNDAPEIAVEDPAPEVDGVVPIQLRLSDTSGDAVSIRVEYDAEGDELGFLPARPGGLDAEDPTPDPALSGIVAPADGTGIVFFWDTDSNLAELERDVRLRFTPIDPVVEGAAKETGTFRVDNNAAPIVQLFNDLVVTNPDERRGIPIPFRVIDEEDDLVEVILQWRHEDEEFPELPTDKAALDETLADPHLRRQHHICTPYPHFAKGRVVPIGEDTVRLPELASSESWILASGIVGKTLELLRPSSIPAPITPTWRSNPLVSPIAALPVGDGLTAFVLDVPGNGRLREIELATGAVVREIATLGQGIPSTMAFERSGKAVLVALEDAGTWRIERVELATGATTELIVSDGAEPAPVRGIASLGTNAAVFTVGASFLHLDYRDPLAPRLGRLLTALATPWGVALDPLPPDRIYASERDANRVLAIGLDSHGKAPVVVKAANMQLGILEAPTAIALERHGSRMLAVTSEPDGRQQLVGLDLGADGENASFRIGDPLAGEAASVASGPDGLRLVAQPELDELLVAGGVEQRRTIRSYEPQSPTLPREQRVVVDPAFDPPPRAGHLWRLRDEGWRLRADRAGVLGRFVWDSTDAHAGPVFLRATARDAESGVPGDGAAGKGVRSALDAELLSLGGFPGTTYPASVAHADLDGDGDQDLVAANPEGEDLAVFFQRMPERFDPSPLLLAVPSPPPYGSEPGCVTAADLDGDGDQDLVSANDGSADSLTVFFQQSSGGFDPSPLVLSVPGSPPFGSGPVCVVAADMDGDGDPDLVSANGGAADNLTAFFQTSSGSYDPDPLIIGGIATTNTPVSVLTADLDGDGDLDLASSNGGPDNLTVFFQRSPGSFDPYPLVLGGLPTTNGPRSIVAEDLDGDGALDLVSANENSNDLTVFFQRSPGEFEPVPLALPVPGGIPLGSGPFALDAADMDGDGDKDLVSANVGSSTLTVFFQSVPGVFDPSPLVLGGLAITDTPFSVATVDLDGDGGQDLVSANLGSRNLTAFLQDTEGFDASPLAIGGYPAPYHPDSVAAADLDGDGDLDLASANEGGDDLTVFFQASLRDFDETPIVLGGFPSTDAPVSITAADLDGDGDQDLVSANFDGNDLTLFFQNSPGGFDPTPLTLESLSTSDYPYSVAAADMDGDGDQDLAVANQSNRNLTVYFQRSPGSFDSTPLMIGIYPSPYAPVSVAAADLDCDGDLDLVGANSSSDEVTVFYQEAPESFAPTPLTLGGLQTTDAPVSVAVTDLNGDGLLDLVSANQFSNNLAAFFQGPLGSFDPAPLLFGSPPEMTSPMSVAAADLDGDGDQDLASANVGSRNLTVFSQSLPGTFAQSPRVLANLGTNSFPFAVAAADLDGDGDQDLVSANVGSDNLAIFWGGR
jgi:hypothetical protein